MINTSTSSRNISRSSVAGNSSSILALAVEVGIGTVKASTSLAVTTLAVSLAAAATLAVIVELVAGAVV